MKHLYWLQAIILLGGTVFAWTMVVQETAPNLFVSMCFYGAVGFTIAFLWSVYLLLKQTPICQKALAWFLAAGTAFAWGNFVYEAWSFYNYETCTIGCSKITTLWQAPCLWGALTFSLALAIALAILSSPKK